MYLLVVDSDEGEITWAFEPRLAARLRDLNCGIVVYCEDANRLWKRCEKFCEPLLHAERVADFPTFLEVGKGEVRFALHGLLEDEAAFCTPDRLRAPPEVCARGGLCAQELLRRPVHDRLWVAFHDIRGGGRCFGVRVEVYDWYALERSFRFRGLDCASLEYTARWFPLRDKFAQGPHRAREFKLDDAPVVCRRAFVDACELLNV